MVAGRAVLQVREDNKMIRLDLLTRLGSAPMNSESSENSIVADSSTAPATFSRADRRVPLLFLLLIPLVTIAYVLYTGHVWEDFFITYRHSRNLAEGNGLLFQPGEKVHGFTSAINVLLPAAFAVLTGESDYVVPLWLYRIVSIAALTIGGFLICRLLVASSGRPTACLYFFALLFALEIKTIAFATNGQEAGFMILFLMLAIVAVVQGMGRFWKVAGLAWAGLMYSRPDGFVYIAAAAAASVVFKHETARTDALKGCLKAAALCTALYLPWFVGTWIYYGSPVPHTILAKSVLSVSHPLPQQVVRGLKSVLVNSRAVFEPIYAFLGGWPAWVFVAAQACGLFCWVYWMFPTADRVGRICSFVFFLVVGYLAVVSLRSYVVPWYLPPAAICGTVVLAVGPAHLARRWLGQSWAHAATAINVACLGFFIFVFAQQTIQMRIQQREIELDHRREIGRWLSGRVGPDEAVFLECLGYIGYFSNARMLDWPGLASPRVMRAARASLPIEHFTDLIPQLEPTWLVLRPGEAKHAMADASTEAQYQLVRDFDVRGRLAQYRSIPGRGYLDIDARFLVYRRSPPVDHVR